VPAGGARPAYLAAVDRGLWVSNSTDGTVSSIDPTSGKVIATVDVGLNPVNLKPGPRGSDEVWVPDDVGDTVIRIDAQSNKLLEKVGVAGGPAILAAVGDEVWVTAFEAGKVAVIKPS
jgi:YVTN family beta-propeller protein